MTATPILLLGLDACDPSTVQRLAAAGQLPAFADALGSGRTASVRNPFAFFVGAVWPTFATGRSADSHGFTCWAEIDPSTYEHRLTHPAAIRGEPFWRAVAAAGRRVGVIDVPHFPARPFDGLQVAEWGAHDRHYGLHSWPVDLAGRLVEQFGLHPALGIDPWSPRHFAPDDFVHRVGLERTLEEEAALLADLLDGVDRKRRLSLHLLGQERWDLFVSVVGDAHAGGHQLWHHHDPRHPRHDPERHRRQGADAIVRLYRALDRVVADHRAAAGDATLLILLSHGMRPHFDGTHLLEEVLRRIDATDLGGPRGAPLARTAKAAWAALPAAIRRRGSSLPAAAARRYARRRPLSTSWHELTAADRSRQRFYLSPNNTVYGGIRLNVAGREARGKVAVHDVDAVCDRLRADLLDIVDVDSGRPAVRDVLRTDAVYDRMPGDRLPDLLVDWDHERPIETVWSPKVGLLHGPFGQWRTGDHSEDGLLIALGSGVEAGRAPPVDMADLAPSLCAAFGVELAGCDGRPVPWLLAALTGAAPRLSQGEPGPGT